MDVNCFFFKFNKFYFVHIRSKNKKVLNKNQYFENFWEISKYGWNYRGLPKHVE